MLESRCDLDCPGGGSELHAARDREQERRFLDRLEVRPTRPRSRLAERVSAAEPASSRASCARADGSLLAVAFSSPDEPRDVFVYDVEARGASVSDREPARRPAAHVAPEAPPIRGLRRGVDPVFLFDTRRAKVRSRSSSPCTAGPRPGRGRGPPRASPRSRSTRRARLRVGAANMWQQLDSYRQHFERVDDGRLTGSTRCATSRRSTTWLRAAGRMSDTSPRISCSAAGTAATWSGTAGVSAAGAIDGRHRGWSACRASSPSSRSTSPSQHAAARARVALRLRAPNQDPLVEAFTMAAGGRLDQHAGLHPRRRGRTDPRACRCF